MVLSPVAPVEPSISHPVESTAPLMRQGDNVAVHSEISAPEPAGPNSALLFVTKNQLLESFVPLSCVTTQA